MSSNRGSPESDSAGCPTPRILGVDPGSLATGWGVVSGGPEPEWIGSGLIRAGTSRVALGDRLSKLHEELGRVVRTFRPGCAAVETLYHGINSRSALGLAHARGVILAVLAAEGIEIVEYAPATVKQAVVGNGRATKEQVRLMVERLLRQPPPHHDASDPWDALACRRPLRQRICCTNHWRS